MLQQHEKVCICIYVLQSKRKKIGIKKNNTSCNIDTGLNADPKKKKNFGTTIGRIG